MTQRGHHGPIKLADMRANEPEPRAITLARKHELEIAALTERIEQSGEDIDYLKAQVRDYRDRLGEVERLLGAR